MPLDDFPDLLEAELQVTVSGDVAKAVDRPPAQLWMTILQFLRKPSRRLGEALGQLAISEAA